MSGQIFISYRREESRWSARSLYDRLAARFDRKQIFMDIDGLALGEDFVKAIEKRVAECDVLIAVIGKHWLTSTDEQDARRLDNPEDFVRREIATALKRGIRVIPVLVDGALMPRSTELPDDLKPLVRRNALEVSDTGFDDDCRRLVAAIEQVLEKKSAEQLEREQKDRLEAGRRETEAKERLETERRAKEAILRRSLKANVEKEPGEGSLALLRFWRSLPRSVRGTLGVLTAGLMIFLVPKLIIEYGPWTPHLKTKPTPVIQTARPTPPLSGWVFYGVVGESMYSHTDFTIVNRDGDIWPRAQDTIVAKYPVKVQDAPELEFSYPRPAPPAPQLGAPSQEDTSPQKDTIPAGAQLKVLEVIQSRANPPDPWGQHVWIRF
jgi:TIR domain